MVSARLLEIEAAMPAVTQVKAKPKPPPYPRLVPDIIVEELLPRQDDNVFYADHDISSRSTLAYKEDADEGEDNTVRGVEDRPPKRRRIEANAHAYLRGQQLYIMSAQLRGPLGNSWKNPWAQRSSRNQDDGYVLGTTAGRSVTKCQEQRLGNASSREQTTALDQSKRRRSQRIEQSSQKNGGITMSRPSGKRGISSGPSAHTDPEVSPHPEALTGDSSKDARVSDWLRTNSSFVEAGSGQLSQSSPTPASHANTIVQVPRSFEEETSLMRHKSKKMSAAFDRVRQLSRNINDILTEPHSEARIADPRPPNDMSDTERDMSRAESVIAVMKRKRATSAGTTTRRPLSEFATASNSIGGSSARQDRDKPAKDDASAGRAGDDEVRSNTGETDIQGNSQIDILQQSGLHLNDLTGQVATHEPAGVGHQQHIETNLTHDAQRRAGSRSGSEPTRKGSVGKPAISNGMDNCYQSTSLSESVGVDALPSAQNLPRLQPSVSSGYFDVRMLTVQTPRLDGDTPQFDVDQDPIDPDQVGCQGVPCSHAAGEPVVRMIEDPIETNLTPMARPLLAEQDIQSMLDAVQPLHLSTAKQQLDRKALREKSMVGIKKAQSKRKRASFASEMSTSITTHNTLKDVMKAKVVKNFGYSPQTAMEKHDVGQENYSVERASSRKALPWTTGSQSNGTKLDKSRLKSTTTTNSQKSNGPHRSILSSSQQHDGQGDQLLHQNGVQLLGDEAFDLEAAIDDLGSFLGTWNAEKEASGLAG